MRESIIKELSTKGSEGKFVDLYSIIIFIIIIIITIEDFEVLLNFCFSLIMFLILSVMSSA